MRLLDGPPRLGLLLAALLVLAALPASPARAQVGGAADAPAVGAPIAQATPSRGPAASSRNERPTFARPADPASAPVYYVIRANARVFASPDSARGELVRRLPLREGVRVLAQEGAWSLVEHSRARGYVPTAALSNVWIRVSKSERTVYVYRGAELVDTLAADVSVSMENKVRRSALGESDHYRMPEGTFFVCRKNDRSQYYRAFVISYPNPEHAARGLREGIISAEQYAAILRADAAGAEPPMNTRLGGLIEIHGHGSGRRRAWTRGCVALRNVHMDQLWAYVHVGTPIIIEA